MKYYVFILHNMLLCSWIYAQDSLFNSISTPIERQYVFATWGASRLGNAQTTETVKKHHLEYRIMQRFGNIFNENQTFNQLAHTVFGLEIVSDIRMSLEYGITDNISLGIGRSRWNELIDLSIKWQFLKQTADFKITVSMALFESIGYTTMLPSKLYANIPNKNFATKEAHRFNYVTQLIIASKLNSKISIELLPTWVHRNFIIQNINPYTGKEDSNDYLVLGIGGRLKITYGLSIFADYFHNLHPYFKNNKNVSMPLSTGIEIQTGGHVFTLFFTNNSSIIENNFLSDHSDIIKERQVKFSFCISRTFFLKR